jgi:transcriptional regulator with XRE-family HTH domain
MRAAIGTNQYVAEESDTEDESANATDGDLIAVRVKALRKALGLTQEALAARAGTDWKRLHITMLESGRNQATSWHHRVGLSRGFGLSIWDLDKYLSGDLSLEATLRRCKAGEDDMSTRPDPVVIPDDRYPSRAEVLVALWPFIDPAARERVASQANFGARDPGALYWIEALARAQRDVELERAGARNAEREAGEREFDELADRDEARAAAARAKAVEAREKKRRGA